MNVEKSPSARQPLDAGHQHSLLTASLSASLLADIKTPMAVAQAAGRSTGVLVAHAVELRHFTHFQRLSRHDQPAIANVLRGDRGSGEARWFTDKGFAGCCLSTATAATSASREVLRELVNGMPDLQVELVFVVAVARDGRHRQRNRTGGLSCVVVGHVSFLPRGPACPAKRPGAQDYRLPSAKEFRAILGDGSYGGRYGGTTP